MTILIEHRAPQPIDLVDIKLSVRPTQKWEQ
jgi:hypothetical protein